MYNGLFEFFVEFTADTQRTVVDFLYLDKSDYSEEDLVNASVEPEFDSLRNSQIYTDFGKVDIVNIDELPPDDDVTVLISGVPDYQTIYPRGCAPAASGCVLGYWDDQGYGRLIEGGGSGYAGHQDPNGIGYLHLTWDELADGMDYIVGTGTPIHRIDDGIRTVSNIVHGYTFSVGYGTWYDPPRSDRTTFHNLINSGRPFVYTLRHPFYGGGAGYHSTTAMGYMINYYDEGAWYYRCVHDNNPGTGTDVYLNEVGLIDDTYINSVTPGGSKAYHGDPDSLGKITLSNFPNPFNPTTTISFTLAQKSNVYCVVYNMLGQQVKNMELGIREAGNHQIVWDGLNQNGQPVAAGTYIIELRTDLGKVTKEISLIK